MPTAFFHEPTATPTPNHTSTALLPVITNTPIPILGHIAAVVQLRGDIIQGDSIIILDENFNIIYKFSSRDLKLSSFSPDGCHLRSISYSNDSFTIREINLYGVETQQITVFPKEVESKNTTYQYNLSPSGRWLAYKVVDQIEMSMRGAKIQDVKLLRVNEQTPQDVLLLTERGGALPAMSTWSMDDHFLAYTDYDEDGIEQIFLFNPEEKREYQITHFGQDMKDHEIQILSWAPNSKAIAFSIVGISETEAEIEQTDNGVVGIISVPDFNLQWVNLKGYDNPICNCSGINLNEL
jgi:Tol biopolymer transport system component